MRRSTFALLLLCGAAIAIIVAVRIVIGPADLYEKDQPKTLAYTADILLNGRWAMPRDVIYQPATKPPLYNWIAAGVMWLTGAWSELAMKSPSVIGAAGVGGLLLVLGRRFGQERGSSAIGLCIGGLATAIWFTFGVEPRHASTIRLLFLARPDMLQAFFLTGAWATATLSVMKCESNRRPVLLAAGFWACVIGAILTKGPLALLMIAYVPIAARLIAGEWRTMRVIRPAVGGLLTLAIVGGWLACAYRAEPDHVRAVMLGAEIAGRVTDSTPEGIRKPIWYAAMWFITKGGPFALLAIGATLFTLVHRRWFRAPDGITLGASVWLLILLTGLSLSAGKRMDYLLPTFPPAAWLAARVSISVCQRARVPIGFAGLLPLLASLWLANGHLSKFHESKSHLSDRAIDFCAEVTERVRPDERLLVIVRGKHPLPVLLRRHQGSIVTPNDLRSAAWLILPTSQTTAVPLLVSEPLPTGFETIEERALAPLGLYRAGVNGPTFEELSRAQHDVGRWTAEENPYRSPGTVWKD